MPEIKIEKDKLDAMLAELAVELAPMLKAEAEELAKGAKEDAPAEESEGSGEPALPPPSEESMAAPAEASAPPAPEASPEASAQPSPEEASAAPEGSPTHEAGEIEPAPTVEALQAEYSKLDPEALKMHYLACKASLMAVMGAGGGAEASAPAPMAPPPPQAQAPAPMAMSEKKLGKSEDQVKIESLEKQLGEQNSALLGLTKAFEKITTPIRKSIKGLSDLKHIARTEDGNPTPGTTLNKSEVREKLKDKIREGKLSKSDKELVAQYTMGNADVSKIEHLLVDAAK